MKLFSNITDVYQQAHWIQDTIIFVEWAKEREKPTKFHMEYYRLSNKHSEWSRYNHIYYERIVHCSVVVHSNSMKLKLFAFLIFFLCCYCCCFFSSCSIHARNNQPKIKIALYWIHSFRFTFTMQNDFSNLFCSPDREEIESILLSKR